MKIRILGILLFLGIGFTISGQNRMLISNVNVVDVQNGNIADNQFVLIEDGVIKSIDGTAPTAKVDVAIDGKSKYLIPGLINMYTHVNEDNLWLYLANGQTTVKDAPSHLTALGLRDKIESGEMIGPRIFAVGLRATGMPAPYASQQPIRTAEEGIAQVREAKRLGYDGMFIYGSCDEDTYQPILAEAEKLDLHITGHFPQNVDLEIALNQTQKSFDNLTGITRRGKIRFDKDAFIEGLLRTKQAITPTLTVHRIWAESDRKDSIYAVIPKEYIPNKMKANWLPVSSGSGTYPYEEVAKLIQEMHQKGVQLYIGSDGGYPMIVNGFSYHDEIRNFSEIGISNEKILAMATIESAQFLGLENLGLVKEGYLADLVLLTDNPFDDMENLKKVDHVIVRGKAYSHEHIQELLTQLKDRLEERQNRFSRWHAIIQTWEPKKINNYQMKNNDIVVGEEMIYINQDDKRNFDLTAVNVMDGPDFRETYMHARVRNRKVDSLYIKSITPEGIYEATVSTGKTMAIIKGTAPFHGNFEYEEPLIQGTLLLGPFTSRYFEMDIAANYVLAMIMKRNLKNDQADQLPVLQIELNSEEYGKKLIVDNSEYTILKMDNFLYKIIYKGMSGYRTITTPSNVIDLTLDEDETITIIKQGTKIIKKK